MPTREEVIRTVEAVSGLNLRQALEQRDVVGLRRAEEIVRHTFGSESQEWYDTFEVCRLIERKRV